MNGNGAPPKSIEIEVNGAKQQVPIDSSFDTSNKKIGIAEIWESFQGWVAQENASQAAGGTSGSANVFSMKNLLDIEHPLGFTFIVGEQ